MYVGFELCQSMYIRLYKPLDPYVACMSKHAQIANFVFSLNLQIISKIVSPILKYRTFRDLNFSLKV